MEPSSPEDDTYVVSGAVLWSLLESLRELMEENERLRDYRRRKKGQKTSSSKAGSPGRPLGVLRRVASKMFTGGPCYYRVLLRMAVIVMAGGASTLSWDKAKAIKRAVDAEWQGQPHTLPKGWWKVDYDAQGALLVLNQLAEEHRSSGCPADSPST